MTGDTTLLKQILGQLNKIEEKTDAISSGQVKTNSKLEDYANKAEISDILIRQEIEKIKIQACPKDKDSINEIVDTRIVKFNKAETSSTKEGIKWSLGIGIALLTIWNYFKGS